MPHTQFKSCNVCGTQWPDCEAFVLDQALHVNGYQASFDGAGDGIIMLTHTLSHCGTTLAIEAGKLRHLYRGADHGETYVGRDECRRLCLDHGRLEECDAPCAMAWVRQVIQYLRRHELPEE